MFVGHAAVALIGKTRVPRLSLGVLFAVSFGLDLPLWAGWVDRHRTQRRNEERGMRRTVDARDEERETRAVG